MYEFLYAPTLVTHGIHALDNHEMPVDVEKGYRYAIGDDGHVIGPYTHIRRYDADGNIDYDPLTPLLEAIGEPQNVVGKATIEFKVAEVTANAHGIEKWTFYDKEKWAVWGFKPPKGWALYTRNGNDDGQRPEIVEP